MQFLRNEKKNRSFSLDLFILDDISKYFTIELVLAFLFIIYFAQTIHVAPSFIEVIVSQRLKICFCLRFLRWLVRTSKLLQLYLFTYC